MVIIFLAYLLVSVHLSAEVSLPRDVHPCVRSDPAVAECLLKEMRRLKNWFVAGLPEYGVPNLDPLLLDNFTVADAGLRTSHTDAQLTGYRDSEVVTFKFNSENKTMVMVLKGTFVFSSNYTMHGQLLLIPVRGKGKCVVELIDATFRTVIDYDIETEQDGLQYFKLGSSKTKGKFGNAKIQMEGLFGENNILSNTINQLINENWRELIKAFGPPITRVINQQINKHIQIFLSKFPYDQIFPEK